MVQVWTLTRGGIVTVSVWRDGLLVERFAVPYDEMTEEVVARAKHRQL